MSLTEQFPVRKMFHKVDEVTTSAGFFSRDIDEKIVIKMILKQCFHSKSWDEGLEKDSAISLVNREIMDEKLSKKTLSNLVAKQIIEVYEGYYVLTRAFITKLWNEHGPGFIESLDTKYPLKKAFLTEQSIYLFGMREFDEKQMSLINMSYYGVGTTVAGEKEWTISS